MKSKILCIVPVMLALAAPAFANDPAPHDEKHEKDKKDKKKDGHDEHEKDGKKDEKKEHPHQ
jgi:ribosomal protein L12E/L44/L45/RPP1/RPP2